MKKVIASLLVISALTCNLAYAESTSTTTTVAVSSSAAAEASPTPSAAPVQVFDKEDGEYLRVGDQCDEVIMLQSRLRDLGYFNYKITNYYGDKTKEAVAAFQKQNGLSADGVAGPETCNVLFNNNAQRAPVKAVVKPTPKPETSSSTSVTGKKHSSGAPVGEMKDWFKWVSKRFTYKDEAYVIDVATGIKFKVIMVGGHNHADVEPATKADTAKLKKIYGGEWSWSRRAVVVYISGRWVAASINGMPHGYETISGNGMEGQVCIHFLNSKTHVRNLPDSDHQAMVKKAAGK